MRARLLLLVLALASAVPSPVQADFNDVPLTHPYAEFVNRLQERGVLTGVNGNFEPSRSLSRAELTKIAVLSAQLPLNSGNYESFIDVPDYHSLYAYVETAGRAHIVRGYRNQVFRPDQAVTRGEAAKIVFNTLKPEVKAGAAFTDVKEGSSFAPFVPTLVAIGAIDPLSPGVFGVDRPITRAEMAKLVMVVLRATGRS